MRTLIVPCAGNRMYNDLPLFLNTYPDGEIVALKTISGVFPETYDKIVYVILDEINKRYNAKKQIEKAAEEKYQVEVVCLEEQTSGPAETVYKAIEKANITGEIVVRDIHAYIKIEQNYTGNFLVGLDLTKYEKAIENLRRKSFISINEQNQILDIVEKHFYSDIISVGLYGFRSVIDFKMAYEHLIDKNYPIKKLYLSHIISYLIGYSQRIFHLNYVVQYEDWSSESAWLKVQKCNATCFLNLDSICGKYLPYSEEVTDTLSKLSKNGMRFVAFTSNNNLNTNEIKSYLEEKEVNIIAVIKDCGYSNVKILASDCNTLNNMLLEV